MSFCTIQTNITPSPPFHFNLKQYKNWFADERTKWKTHRNKNLVNYSHVLRTCKNWFAIWSFFSLSFFCLRIGLVLFSVRRTVTSFRMNFITKTTKCLNKVLIVYIFDASFCQNSIAFPLAISLHLLVCVCVYRLNFNELSSHFSANFCIGTLQRKCLHPQVLALILFICFRETLNDFRINSHFFATPLKTTWWMRWKNRWKLFNNLTPTMTFEFVNYDLGKSFLSRIVSILPGISKRILSYAINRWMKWCRAFLVLSYSLILSSKQWTSRGYAQWQSNMNWSRHSSHKKI